MAESSPSFPVIREAVASFPDREHFHRAVSNLLAAGFETSDLSVLASHNSLAAAGEPPAREPKLLPAGLADEIKYIAPLTVAGIILLSGGPIAVDGRRAGRRRSRWRGLEGTLRRLHRAQAQSRISRRRSKLARHSYGYAAKIPIAS